jgi:hypothetical protein
MSDETRVSIRYMNGTTVEAASLEDAIVHVAHQGVDYVTDVVEDLPEFVPCKHCGGDGVVDGPKPKTLLTRKQVEEKVAAVNDQAPVAEASFEDRVAVARDVASA